MTMLVIMGPMDIKCMHSIVQEMSELAVVGHHPGAGVGQEVATSRMRLRTDSLDSLGDSDSLSDDQDHMDQR